MQPRSPQEWQEVARQVTDPLPTLSERQRRDLTRVAAQYGRRKQTVAVKAAVKAAA